MTDAPPPARPETPDTLMVWLDETRTAALGDPDSRDYWSLCGLKDRIVRAEALCASQSSEIARLREDKGKLLNFAGLVLRAHKNFGEPCDVEGGDLQDIATRTGMMAPRQVDRPCSDECACDGYGDWPMTCYRLTDLGGEAVFAAAHLDDAARSSGTGGEG